MGAKRGNGSLSPMKWKWLMVVLAAGQITTALAEPTVEGITELQSSGKNQEAYTQAKALQPTHEGEPDFDLAFGLSALATGHVSEGVLALERVVALQPTNVKARFELARAYYQIGDNVRARREFEQLMPVVTSEQDKEVIRTYLSAIRQRELLYQTTSAAYVQLGIGFDSNINSAPTGDLADNLLPFHLGADATDKHDSFGVLAMGGQLDYPITRRVGVYGQMNGQLFRYRDHDEFKNSLLSTQFGAKWSYRNYLVKASALAQAFTVNEDLNRKLYGATIEALDGISPQYTIGTALNYLDIIYPDQPLRDSNQVTLGINLAKRWASRGEPMAYAGLFGGQERSKDQSEEARSVADRKLYGLQAGIDYKLSESLGTRLTLLGQKSEYSAPFLALPILPKRSETFSSAELSMTWLADKDWKAIIMYGYSTNDSNIDMYSFNRSKYSLNLRRDF